MSHVNFKFSKDFSTSKKGDVKRLYKPLAVALRKRGLGAYSEKEESPAVENKELKPVKAKK
jgi:hypothetical protein